MPNRTVTTIIDRDTCIGCGQCVRVCPSDTLSMQDGKAAVTGDQSLNCGHCAAICPVEAVRVHSLENDQFAFESFRQDDTSWLPFGAYDTAGLVRLMRSRRSCRNYTARPVERPILNDLVRTGIAAPSGTNSQPWTFTILPTRKDVTALGDEVGRFFHRLNRTAEKSWLRLFLKLIGKPSLDVYYREYYQSVEDALAAYEQEGIDRLFHGATAAVVVASRSDASCPAEDALLATQNILLAAHAMGLGTCLIGFAVEAMKNDPSIRKGIQIPDYETVRSVIALGYPDETYQRLTGRKPATIRYVDGG